MKWIQAETSQAGVGTKQGMDATRRRDAKGVIVRAACYAFHFYFLWFVLFLLPSLFAWQDLSRDKMEQVM